MPIRWLMLVILFLVRLAMGYQFQSVAAVSAHLIEAFGFSYAEIGTLIGLFLVPGIVVALPSGLLTRSVTDKNLLLAGAVVMVAGGLIMAFAGSPTTIYAGRLVTGVGGVIFNVILTKMVTDWFFGKEIVTALAIVLTAWPFGIALGLMTQGLIADRYGWQWTMHATALFAAVGFLLTLLFYRAPPRDLSPEPTPLRFILPWRQFVHIGLVGLTWTMFNTNFILIVSFAPDAIEKNGISATAAHSITSLAMWVSMAVAPFGGRLVELSGRTTAAILVTLLGAALLTMAIPAGRAPELTMIAYGVVFSIPVGTIMSLTSEAVRPENRGPGLGIFYTWYYAGMGVGPALAGWSRDVSGSAAAPLHLAAGMLLISALSVLLFRLLQRRWPI